MKDVVTKAMIDRVRAGLLVCESCGWTIPGVAYRIPPGKGVGFSRKGRGLEPKFPCWNCEGSLAIMDGPKEK